MKGNIIGRVASIASVIYVVSMGVAHASYDVPRDLGFCVTDTECVALDGRPITVPVEGEVN